MSWQDIVIAIANLLFAISLLGQVHYGYKQKKGFIILKTSGLTAFGLYAMTIAFFTLTLYTSAVVALVNAVLWTVLFIQRVRYGS